MTTSDMLEAAVKAWDHFWGDRYGDEAVEEMGEEVGIALAAADAVRFSEEAVERLYRELSLHHPTRGMAVSMGVTCECGYWTGTEQGGKNRPVGVRGDQLDWHRTQVTIAVLKGED